MIDIIGKNGAGKTYIADELYQLGFQEQKEHCQNRQKTMDFQHFQRYIQLCGNASRQPPADVSYKSRKNLRFLLLL